MNVYDMRHSIGDFNLVLISACWKLCRPTREQSYQNKLSANDMLCYAMLCYAMLCYAMLCYALLVHDNIPLLNHIN